ncbi:hypothetical protein [Sphingosinicella soli]|uniref:Uncharacterized protein n=1 Tax=Sphingosinicella soli TaxID=333708 RepID=A0A7W7B132_9SPHN|nr:hypothetical protein [Sphingosinicella soli]MBB4632098.1 hypothetical protein [Sphingosinicella soli]
MDAISANNWPIGRGEAAEIDTASTENLRLPRDGAEAFTQRAC